jgi:FeS assembly ATPase SufC
MSMLEIKDLKVSAEGKEILKGIDLVVNTGEVHAIMGPNGSGKSTLARALSGHPEYVVTGGTVTYEGKDLLEMDPDERARDGVFMAFQYPVEIAGVHREVDAFENLFAFRRNFQVFDFKHAHCSQADLKVCATKADAVRHSAVAQAFRPAYTTEPSSATDSSFCASTANSIGSSRKTSLQKPLTIMFTASSVGIPRWRQ